MNANEISSLWPYNWYGIWADSDDPTSEFPSLQSAIDRSWNQPDKGQLVRYLSQAPIAVAGGAIMTCRLCTSQVPMTTFQSDGIWLWPKGLVHYVVQHFVVLPDRLVEHIRRHLYDPPQDLGRSTHELPWPNSFAVMKEKW